MARALLALRAFDFLDNRNLRGVEQYGFDVEHLADYSPAARIFISEHQRNSIDGDSRLHAKSRASDFLFYTRRAGGARFFNVAERFVAAKLAAGFFCFGCRGRVAR